MTLSDALRGVDAHLTPQESRRSVTGVCQDSRHFKAGDVFVAIQGHKFDGHDFAIEASARGASAIIAERETPLATNAVPVILVSDSRRALDQVAANYYGRPSEKLFMVGITGTNGKTTTANMVEAVLNQGHIPTGVIGTIDAHLGYQKELTTHTTPDALTLQNQLARWQQAGAKAVSMEVSSHALSLNRVESLEFDVAVFTNLTRDHLDFHQTMDEYVKAKGRLFRELLSRSKKPSKRAILNGEDSYWQQMKPDHVPVWTYGFTSGDIQARDLKLSFEGAEFVAHTPSGDFTVNLQMIGQHNIANSLCAIGVGLHAGLAGHVIADGLSQLQGVSGRLQRVASDAPVRVFVDYAHTDDALSNVLNFLSELRNDTTPQSKIITVFGCGGDRDRGKRPLMLKAAQRYSDHIIVTSDNPRTEDPQRIIKDILGEDIIRGGGQEMAGDSARGPGQNGQADSRLTVEVDRRRAIERAIERARPQDVVLIAGKGHENYQIIGEKKIPFDDVTIAKEILG